jgi:hypothetical protein
MYDHNQLELPDSFLALYLTPGHLKPTATRATITARYELCEDLASHLEAYAQARHHDLDIPQAEVLARCHQGLLSADSGVSVDEARWVILRLAELAGWACPDLDAMA